MNLPAETQIQSIAVAGNAHSRWPRWLRRGPMELFACAIIGLGILMMLQPFALELFTYSFVVTLGGTVLFTIVSKFPA
jgi:hypothetical protein